MRKIILLGALAAVGMANAQSVAFDNTVSQLTTTTNWRLNGGAGVDNLQATNTATQMLMTKITPLASLVGQQFTQVEFYAGNFGGTATINARARYRIFADNTTTPGTPGVYITGATFGQFAYGVGINVHHTGLITGFVMPSVFWFGLTFDNNVGTSGATIADLNNLGTSLAAGPPAVGTIGSGVGNEGALSVSPTGGNFSNPPSTVVNFGVDATNHPFNMAVKVTAAPEPASMAVLGVGALAMLRRRRNKKA